MIRVFPSMIAWSTWRTASCAVRFGRYPYDPDWKSASKIGSRISLSAPWTTRSRIAGIDRTRTFLPPSLGISFFRARLGRYVFETSSSCICSRKPLHSTFFDGLERDSVYSRRPVVFFRHPVGFVERLPFADVDVKSPETPGWFRLRLDV